MISRFWIRIIEEMVVPLNYIRKYRKNRVGKHSRFRILYIEFEEISIWKYQVDNGFF